MGGGGLSPLLWCLVVDEQLVRLDMAGIYAQGYADDLAIVIRARDANTASSLAQRALNLVSTWFREIGLSVNPAKTELVRFTRWRKLVWWKDVTFRGIAIGPTEEVKHLRVILDAKRNWGRHMKRIRDKAYGLMWATKRACGATRGLSPRLMHWLYTAVIRPIVLYGAVVWWGSNRLKTARDMLTHVQRPAGRGTTSAMRPALNLALDTLLNWPPLYVMVQGAAAMASYKLMKTAKWQGKLAQWSHTSIAVTLREASPAAFMRQDRDLVRYRFDTTCKVVYPDRTSWTTKTGPLQGQELIWYMDGSKTEEGSGAGVCLSASHKEVSIPLVKHCTVF